MSREIEVTCPSGLKVRFRSMKGKDIDPMYDKRRSATGEATSRLMNDCTLEVIDPGVYSQLPKFDWADALVGDRTYATISLRAATMGDDYEFRTRCQDRECGAAISWVVQLNELTMKPLPDHSKAAFTNGNRFETTLDGRVVTHKLNTGRDAAKLAKILQQAQLQSQKSNGKGPSSRRSLISVGSRIVAVEGVESVQEWLSELDFKDVTELVEKLSEVDCGVETGIQIECQSCGFIQEVELPLDSRFFEREH